MSKHRLLLDDEFDYLAFGLSCHLKDHRVAWLIERTMGLTFKRSTFTLKEKSGHIQEYPMFKSQDEDVHMRYVILSNFSDESVLIRNQKEYDFFILVEGYLDIFDASLFQQKIQGIESFQFLTPLNKELFSKLQYAIFEE